MYKLRKHNVVKTVDTIPKRDTLLAKGFQLVEEVKKPTIKKAEKEDDT
ncbi:hypothetical protein [Metasolibacillus meyeri]|nr:hypothetical protein [Metasolibacillus meyeri]